MKKFKILFLITALALLVIAGQSCRKASAEDNFSNVEMVNDEGDSEIIEDFELQEDPIGYEPDAVGAAVTGGTKVTLTEDADNDCTEFKYAKPSASASWVAPIKVGTGGVTLTLALTGLPVGSTTIDSIVNTNSTTGKYATAEKLTKVGGKLLISDITPGVDSTAYTFKISTETDDFTAGSASCKIYWRVIKAGVTTVKYKSVTVKCIGLSASGKTFGTQRWGYDKVGGASGKYATTPTAIDTVGVGNFVPAVGMIVCFGANKRGVIDSVSITPPLSTASATTKAKGDKQFFRYTMYNYNCKSSKKVGKVTVYREVMPNTKFLYKDGPALSGFVE